MNYTKNYHLPQWEETDRVLMEDFNQMCMNLEDALSRMAPSVQAADHMSRDLYRQAVQQRLRHGVDDRTDSMWLNSLTTRADAGGEGHGWNGRYGVAWGSWALPTVEGIKATATELCWANGSDPTPRSG